MSQQHSKADLFEAMGLGPVWELRQSASVAALEQTNVPAESMSPPAHEVNLPSLNVLRETVAQCRACGLCETRKQTVFADGVENAPLMVVGEAPGAEEDAKGFPFVGRAGQLLDQMLKAVGASRAENTYIANVLKCRPPANRNPEPEEIEHCKPYLFQQIQANNPKVLLLVGRFAIHTLLKTDKAVSQLRGQVHKVQVNGVDIPAVVTYHPAYLLRKPSEKAKVWDDLLLLKQQK